MKKENRKLIGIIGLVLIVLGIFSSIPSAINNIVAGITLSGLSVIIGLILALYGLID